jgi:uncharacterized protein (TIGR02266 family)
MDMETKTAERRCEPRHQTNLEVDYAADSTFMYAYIKDISSTGIFVRATEVQPVGTLLQLRFSSPAAAAAREPFAVEGEVMWNISGQEANDGAGMGIRFTDMGEKTRQRVLELVRKIAYLDDDR